MVLDGTGSVYDVNGWYLVSISWYCLILGGTMSAKGLYAYINWKKWRFGWVTPMPHISQTKEYRATQFVYSIKFKLSHAISNVILKVSPQICFTKQVLHQRIIPPGEDMPPKSRMDVTRNFPPKKTWQHKPKMMLLQKKKRMKAILTKTMCKLTSNLLDVSDQNHAKRYLLLWLKSLLSNAIKWRLN